MIFNEISGVVKRACMEIKQNTFAKKHNLSEKMVSAIVNNNNYSINYDVMIMMRNLGYDIKLVKRTNVPMDLDKKNALSRDQGYESYGKWEAARFLEQQKAERALAGNGNKV